MTEVGNLDTKLEGYFKLSFIIEIAGNLDAMWWGYFELCFIIIDMGNLYINLGDYFESIKWKRWVIYI